MRTRIGALDLSRYLNTLSPDQWFFIGFALLLLAFFFVLLVEPSSVGRGGR